MIKEAIVRALRWIVKGTPNVRITANIVETGSAEQARRQKSDRYRRRTRLRFYIARKCRQEGASVLIAGRDERVLQEASQRLCDCPYLVFDVRRTAGIAAFLSEADRLLGGRVDCLVNNAGISLHEKSFADVTEEGFDRQFDTNLKGPYFLTQTFIDYMNREKIGQGNILFITSERGLYCDDIPYGLTKAAINSLTTGLARRLIAQGIRVNAIAPGVTASDMTGSIRTATSIGPLPVPDGFSFPKRWPKSRLSSCRTFPCAFQVKSCLATKGTTTDATGNQSFEKI